MDDASTYPVSFRYGAQDGVYYYIPTAAHPKTANWVGNYHKGDDHAMPVGTPVIVNGFQLGLSGSMYGGPHLHVGRFVGGLDTNPQGGGFRFNSATVTEIDEDPINGKFVRVQADGASWVYLHLSSITISNGKELKNGMPFISQEELDDLNGHKKVSVAVAASKAWSDMENNGVKEVADDLWQFKHDHQNDTGTPKLLAPGVYKVN